MKFVYQHKGVRSVEKFTMPVGRNMLYQRLNCSFSQWRICCYQIKTTNWSNRENIRNLIPYAAFLPVKLLKELYWSGRLSKIFSNDSITYGKVYWEILEEILQNFIVTLSKDMSDENFIFKHNFTSWHRSDSTTNWHSQYQINIISYPSNSPYLNLKI